MIVGFLLLAEPLHWVAPAECPTQAEVHGAVEHYVARELADESLQARAAVERGADGAFELRLTIETEGVSVERRLADPDCRVLADAAALMVAIALDPNAASRASEPVLAVDEAAPVKTEEPVPDVQPEPPAAPKNTAAPAKPKPEPKPKPKRECLPGRSALRSGDLRPACGAIGVNFGLQLGPLPRLGPGVGGHIAALWPRLQLELRAAHWFQQPARNEDGVGGDIRLTTGTAVACGRLGVARVEFPLCAGIELGSLYGRGFGLDPTSREERLLWSAFVADARASWSPLRRFAIAAAVGTAVPFVAYRFDVDGIGTIHTVAPASLRAGLEAQVRFP